MLPALRLPDTVIVNEDVFSVAPAGFEVAIEADRDVEGPVLRVLGGLEQGLFAGIEHLGRGERSSSKLDLETPEHRRFTPPRRHVTLPLMAVVTEHALSFREYLNETINVLWQRVFKADLVRVIIVA